MEREALKLAEIIEHFDSNDESLPLELLKEIAATLRALAQPVQEPPSEWAGIKAILDEYGLQAIDFVADFKATLAQPAQKTDMLTIAYQSGYYDGKKAAHRQWVGLTDEEAAWCQSPTVTETWKRIEAKLKEKNHGT